MSIHTRLHMCACVYVSGPPLFIGHFGPANFLPSTFSTDWISYHHHHTLLSQHYSHPFACIQDSPVVVRTLNDYKAFLRQQLLLSGLGTFLLYNSSVASLLLHFGQMLLYTIFLARSLHAMVLPLHFFIAFHSRRAGKAVKTCVCILLHPIFPLFFNGFHGVGGQERVIFFRVL